MKKYSSIHRMRFFYALLFCCVSISAFSQDDINSFEARRTNSLMFFNELQILSTPSTVSGSILNCEFYENQNFYKQPFILNADVQFPIALGGRGWYSNKLKLYSTFHVIPQFKVRILQEDAPRGDSSLPVRTPSYMPRIWWYFTSPSILSETKITYFGLSAFHHSNGQDGPEFVTPSMVGPNNILGDVNRYNGNFGENCVFEAMLGGIYKSGVPKQLEADNDVPDDTDNLHIRFRTSNVMYDKYFKASFEWHPKSLTNRDLMLYDIYSRYRMNLQLGLIVSHNSVTELWNTKSKKWCAEGGAMQKERFRIVFDANFLMGKFNTGNLSGGLTPAPFCRRINLWATCHVRIPGTKMSSGFVQVGYWGSDNYNIYFNQRMIMAQVGLSFGFYRYGDTREWLEPKCD